MKEKLGDNPDFQPVPHFEGGNSRPSVTDFKMDTQAKAMGRNFVNQQKKWPLESPCS